MDEYKIAFIHGVDDLERNIFEGKVEKYGDFTENKNHIVYLLDYVKEKYPDKEVFKLFNERHQPEVLAFILTEFHGDVIFFNTTRYIDNHPNKYGYTGMFLLPKKMSDETVDATLKFCKEIENYNVNVIYNLGLDEGTLCNDMILDDNLKTPDDKVKKAVELIRTQKTNTL